VVSAEQTPMNGKICSIVGARPQFIKAAAVGRELRRRFAEVLIHTGQHYDESMSSVFFEELEIPPPDYNLDIRSGPHGRQTGAMLGALEEVLIGERPDLVLIYGDTNSTLAGALAAAKLHLPIAHVEAGLRSFNREMPEEINRIPADEISTLLFCPTATAVDNLRREGVTSGVFLTGDVMLDALMRYREKPSGGPALLQSLNLNPGGYRLLTIHRAGNTDSVSNLGSLLAALGESGTPIVFPVHPRTRGRISEAGLAVAKNIRCIDPVGYLEMLFLERNADLILTDSGGIQKEAYIFGVPCVTLREETEWVETVAAGWNTLAGTAPETILSALLRSRPKSERPKIFGSGTSSALITDILLDFLARGSA